MAIKILIDSASDISQKEAEQLGIYLIPLEIRFGNDEYLDGVNLLPNEFYEKLIESSALPQTSQINPFRFEEVFEELTADGSQLLVITLSSKLSGTNESARTAAEKFKGKVFVFDTLSAAIGERLLCTYAKKLIDQGKGMEEILTELEDKRGKLNVMAMVDTLEYLKRGGRISSAVALAGTLLSIKPVVALIDGEVKLIGKAMGSKKANNLINSLVEKKGGINFNMPFGVVWAGMDDTVLKKYVRDNAHLWKHATDSVPAFVIGCTIGTHVGPGAIGVAFFDN